MVAGRAPWESVHNQVVIQCLDHSMDNSDQQTAPRVFSSVENKEFKNAIDDCLQQLTNLELEKVSLFH